MNYIQVVGFRESHAKLVPNQDFKKISKHTKSKVKGPSHIYFQMTKSGYVQWPSLPKFLTSRVLLMTASPLYSDLRGTSVQVNLFPN